MKTARWYGVAAVMAAVSVAVISYVQGPVHAQGRSSDDFVAPAVFQGAGPTVASISGLIDQFRLAIGGGNNGNNGAAGSGRREINWDGLGSTATSLVPTPFTGFLVSRGALFTTPGSGFVQAPLAGIAQTFGNPSYETAFQVFSPLRLFSPISSNITDTTFFLPGGGNTPALTAGFGAVFSDVDQPDGSGPGGKRGNRGPSTLIQFFGANGDLLYSSWVPASPGTGGLSFFAVLFNDARIARVRIIAGDDAPGPDDTANRDIVMLDDFIYAEPHIGG